jgi:hypothetical protein
VKVLLEEGSEGIIDRGPMSPPNRSPSFLDLAFVIAGISSVSSLHVMRHVTG